MRTGVASDAAPGTATPAAVVTFDHGRLYSTAPGPRRYWNRTRVYAGSFSTASLARRTTLAPWVGKTSPARPTLNVYPFGSDRFPARSLAHTRSVRVPSSVGVTDTVTGPVAVTVVGAAAVSSW